MTTGRINQKLAATNPGKVGVEVVPEENKQKAVRA